MKSKPRKLLWKFVLIYAEHILTRMKWTPKRSRFLDKLILLTEQHSF